jgi:hypothetical protein
MTVSFTKRLRRRECSAPARAAGLVAALGLLGVGVGACGESTSSNRGTAAATAGQRSFSVLRRPAGHADVPPPLAVEAVLRSNAVHAMGGTVVPPASARRLALGALPAWALAAPGAVCLLHEVRLLDRPAVGYAFTCLPTREAEAGRLLATVFPVAGHPGMTLIEGLLPDRAGAPAVELAKGGRAALSVGQNAYAGVAHNPVAVTFRLAGSAHRVPVPGSPAAVPRRAHG